MRRYVINLHFDLKLEFIDKGRYAYIYDCPRVFVFDSRYFIILQFKAHSRDEILSPDCSIGS